MSMEPPSLTASRAFFRRLKNTCSIWAGSSATDGRALGRLSMTETLRSSSCGFIALRHPFIGSAMVPRTRFGLDGLSAWRKPLIMPESRSTCLMHSSTSPASAHERLRSWRFSDRALSGFPISCATPAARSLTARVAPILSSSSVRSRSAVTSLRHTSVPSPIGIVWISRARASGYVMSISRFDDLPCGIASI